MAGDRIPVPIVEEARVKLPEQIKKTFLLIAELDSMVRSPSATRYPGPFTVVPVRVILPLWSSWLLVSDERLIVVLV